MPRIAILLVLMLVPAAAVTAAEDLAPQVRQLVRQLNDPELTKRDAAEQALTELGPAALTLLPKTDARTPAETAQRLARIRQALQRAVAEDAGKPGLVTLKANAMPLAEVLTAISAQTGNKIVDHRGEFGEELTQPPITVDFKDVPYWMALDTVLDQAGLSVYPYAAEKGTFLVRQVQGHRKRSEASYSGAFRITATRVEAVRDLAAADNGSLKVFTELSWEPRLTPIAISEPLDTVVAEGSGGEKLPVAGAEGESEASVSPEMSTVELMVPLALPERDVLRIASLKGQLRALVPGKVETFRFDQLPLAKDGQAKKVEVRKAGVTVTVDQLRKNNEVWEVRMRVKFDDPANALESHRGWIFENEAFLIGADSKRIEPGGYEHTRQTDDEVGVAYLFDLPKGPAGLSFVYKSPLSILTLPIEYDLRDLPLP